MKMLIAEDDLTSRMLLQKFLDGFGSVHAVVNGQEAVDAVHQAMDAVEPYELICLDMLMPVMDGQQALVEIRKLENHYNISPGEKAKIIMITAVADLIRACKALMDQCNACMAKPLIKNKLHEELRKLGLIE